MQSDSVSIVRFSTVGKYLSSRSKYGSIGIWNVAERINLARLSVRSSPNQAPRPQLKAGKPTDRRAGREIGKLALASSSQGAAEVRFPVGLHRVARHPSAGVWAGAWLNQWFLIAAERFGDTPDRRPPSDGLQGHAPITSQTS
jgi:hypothetical protein